MKCSVFLVEGETVKCEDIILNQPSPIGLWKFGHYGETRKEIKEYTGKSNYNMDIDTMSGMMKTKGVVNDEGTRITVWSDFCDEIDHFVWIGDEGLNALRELGDPVNAPSHHYKLQPDTIGRLLWLTGPPGVGKSTTAQILSKNQGYVFYEGDCFCQCLNPYTSPDVAEPSLAQFKHNPLKGLSEENARARKNGGLEIFKMMSYGIYDEEKLKAYYKALCENIRSERARIGGDWVIAHAVPSRSLRDYIKKELSSDFTFVVLNMSKEETKKRIISRHGDGEKSSLALGVLRMCDPFEPVQCDEEKAIEVGITNDMNREDVVKEVLRFIPSLVDIQECH